MLEDMIDHVNFILVKNDLYVYRWLKNPKSNSTDLDGDEIKIAIIKDEETYCSALHEFGHVILETKDELKAWKWAKRNAYIWTDKMQEIAEKCLKEYEICLGVKYDPL